ncbi:MAG: glycosyltransferase, partial [Novosphingobium sp.]|nr:glycosyltransferase [Novosphingobium sp.]
MPDHPRFSVLIPCFNAAPYLGATLDSVRKQGHPSVEVIVMDGGSTDGTVELVRNYRGLRIVWESGPDRGQLEAVQKAACRASGDIL